MDRASASGKFTEEVPPPPPRGGGLSLTSSKQKIPGSTPGMVKRGRSRLTAGFPFCFVLFCFVLFCSYVFCPPPAPPPSPPRPPLAPPPRYGEVFFGFHLRFHFF